LSSDRFTLSELGELVYELPGLSGLDQDPQKVNYGLEILE
jgi:hypothetical protein